MEAVTGLLRRTDANLYARQIPVGVLPVGFKNQMARNLFPDTKDDVKLMADCAMSVIKQHFRPVDVIEVKSEGKSLYGLREIIMGSFSDAYERREKYWYWAGLKKYVTYVFSFTTSASKLMWSLPSQIKLGTIEKSEVVEDIAKPDSNTTEQPSNTRASWWSYIVPTRASSKPQESQSYSQDGHHLKWSDESISFSGTKQL